jgi:hypothetical protein
VFSITVATTPTELLGRYPAHSYQVNRRMVDVLRQACRDGASAVGDLVHTISLAFAAVHDLGALKPRHDVMDHCLPFRHSLNTSDIHEVLSDLTKTAVVTRLLESTTGFPTAEFETIVRTRVERFGFVPDEHTDYLDEASRTVWENGLEFYWSLSIDEVALIWDVAACQHEHARGRPRPTSVLESLNADAAMQLTR